jgi:hypothetical protein
LPKPANNRLSDQPEATKVMTRFESALLPRPSRPQACPSDRPQATEVLTRFESARLACPSQPKHLSVGPESSQRSDDSIRVSTCCLPKPARHEANEVLTRFESAPLVCPSRPQFVSRTGYEP